MQHGNLFLFYYHVTIMVESGLTDLHTSATQGNASWQIAITLVLWFSVGGNLAPPWDIRQCLDMFLVVTTGRKVLPSNSE